MWNALGLVLAAAVASTVWCVGNRYELHGTQGDSSTAVVWRIDRWTGETCRIWFIPKDDLTVVSRCLPNP